MPKFSQKSLKKLYTCHPDLQEVFQEVVKHFDCTIISGHRSSEEQRELYKKGRSISGPKVTYKDGYNKRSKHNYYPSLAVDVVPYPIDSKNTDRMKLFIGFVLGIATELKEQGIIFHEIVSGIDWDKDTFIHDHEFQDHPHFQMETS